RLDLSTAGLAPTVVPVSGAPAGAEITGLARVASPGVVRLVALDANADRLSLIEVDPGGASASVIATLSLPETPTAIAVSSGGHWAFVVLETATGAEIRAVNLVRLAQGLPVSAGAAVPLQAT